MNRKTILCAIDFSESSLQTLKWALAIGQQTQAHVTILFCYRLITENNDGEMIDLKKNMENEALKKFNQIEKKLKKTELGSFQFITEVGFFPHRIEMYIRKSPVSLLVMENSIVQNFEEYKKLSFDEFLKNSGVPVLIVPSSKDLVSA